MDSIDQRLWACRGAAYSTYETLRATADLTQDVLRQCVPGLLVECGVAAGVQLAAMWAACAEEGAINRQLVGFDSFQGIPWAGPRDDVQPGIGGIDQIPPEKIGKLESSGITVHGQAQVERNLVQWGVPRAAVRLVPGWFQDTVPVFAQQCTSPIAVLRLDGDLYASTLVCMQHLFPRLSRGGVLIVDDYALKGCREAVHDVVGPHVEFTPIEGGGGPAWARF